MKFISLEDIQTIITTTDLKNISKKYLENAYIFKVENGILIKKINGVSIIDPGVNFGMIVNAINGVGDFFEVDDGFCKKYNTKVYCTKKMFKDIDYIDNYELIDKNITLKEIYETECSI